MHIPLLSNIQINLQFGFFILIVSSFPFGVICIHPVGSCHLSRVRPLGLRMGERPPDMEVNYEYIK